MSLLQLMAMMTAVRSLSSVELDQEVERRLEDGSEVSRLLPSAHGTILHLLSTGNACASDLLY